MFRLVSKNSGVGGCRKRRTSSVCHILRDFRVQVLVFFYVGIRNGSCGLKAGTHMKRTKIWKQLLV